MRAPPSVPLSMLPNPTTFSVPTQTGGASKGTLRSCFSTPDVAIPRRRVDTELVEEPVVQAVSMSRRGGGIDQNVLREMIREVR